MQVNKSALFINNKDGNEITADIFRDISGLSEKNPVIIFCHGFKGFKDWGGFPYMMEKLASEGFITISFNFSFNGVTKDNPSEFTRLDLFAQNTFSKELDDLGEVIDYFYNNAGEYNIDKNKIALIGHSRGGGIAIIKTAEDKRIKALVTLASVSTFGRYTDEQKSKWKAKGFLSVENSRTKQIMKLNYSLMEDIERNKERLDILKSISVINVPVLILHGKEDLAVQYNSAEELYENSNKEKTELFIINNTGHTFGAVHPFKGTTKAFENVIEKTAEFLKKNL